MSYELLDVESKLLFFSISCVFFHFEFVQRFNSWKSPYCYLLMSIFLRKNLLKYNFNKSSGRLQII